MANSQARRRRFHSAGRAETVAAPSNNRHLLTSDLRPRSVTSDACIGRDTGRRTVRHQENRCADRKEKLSVASRLSDGQRDGHGVGRSTSEASPEYDYRAHIARIRHRHFEHHTSDSEDGEFIYRRCAHCNLQYCAMTANTSAFCCAECRHSFRLQPRAEYLLTHGGRRKREYDGRYCMSTNRTSMTYKALDS